MGNIDWLALAIVVGFIWLIMTIMDRDEPPGP